MIQHFIHRNRFGSPIAVEALVILGCFLGQAPAQDIQRGVIDFQPSASEAKVPEHFKLKSSRFQWELKLLRQSQRHHVWALRYPSPMQGDVAENNVVHAEYFLPASSQWTGQRLPAAVVLHILGADFPLSRFMAARLADNGVAALFIQLPYYGKRKPPGRPEVKFLSADMERSQLAMQQGVQDIRRGFAWLAARPEVDAANLYCTGVSLGGIMSALTVAVDPQVKGGVFTLAGGGLADILWNMPEKEARVYRAAWEKSGRTFNDLRTLVDRMDPLTYAGGLKDKRIKMIAAKVDEVVPPRSAKALWQAAGQPPIIWYDAGHYSAVAFILPALDETISFIRNLQPALPRAPALPKPSGAN
ncbi:MAG: alpha/beta hydrolase family protein [bacterium]